MFVSYNQFIVWRGGTIMAQDKRGQFVKLAEARTNKIINMIRLLGNCSNTSNYAYTESDVNQIFSAIENELKECKKKFQSTTTEKSSQFKLK